MRKILITAHSGCEGTPENSLESILTGIELGADCVEIDIRMDESGALWLTHDTTGDYSTALPLPKAFEPIARSGIAVNCDIKEARCLYPVIVQAEKSCLSREQLIFSGAVDVRALESDPTIAQRARIFLNLEELCCHLSPIWPLERPEQVQWLTENIADAAAFMNRVGAECLNAPFTYMPKEIIDLARTNGIELSLWTVNREEDQVRLLREDLLNMTTRSVSSALRLRDKKEEKA